ncbi:hypothetical protein WJX73_006682 [Symbiochloris irregularis]|uniref:Uncharacterized protein n=1 Tax=Symbiochloris irregularis TaxID=706552 RepID=A0AAW1PPF0_9CHLO
MAPDARAMPNGTVKGIPPSISREMSRLVLRGTRSEAALHAGVSCSSLPGPADWETQNSTGRLFKLIKQAHQERAHQLLRLQNLKDRSKQLQSSRDAKFLADLDRQRKFEEKNRAFQQELALHAIAHERELQQRRALVSSSWQEHEAGVRAAWEDKESKDNARLLAEAHRAEMSMSQARSARAQSEAMRQEEMAARIATWKQAMREKIDQKDETTMQRITTIEARRQQLAACMAEAMADKAAQAQGVLARHQEQTATRIAGVQEKWRAEDEHVGHLQQVAERQRLEKVSEAARIRAIAEQRIDSVAQSRAAAQDRTNQKLLAKQDRINFLEDKRSTLLQHLANLRQDISSLDVSIRAAHIHPGLESFPELPPELAEKAGRLPTAHSLLELESAVMLPRQKSRTGPASPRLQRRGSAQPGRVHNLQTRASRA